MKCPRTMESWSVGKTLQMSMGRDKSHTDPALLQTILLAGEEDLKGCKTGGEHPEKKRARPFLPITAITDSTTIF